MEIRPYKLLCSSELACISGCLREAWSSWCAHWLPGVKPDLAACVPADTDSNDIHRGGQEWRRFLGAEGAELRIATDAALPTQLAGLAFEGCVPQFGLSGSEPSRLLTDLMNVMLADLGVRVFRAAGHSIASAGELVQEVSGADPQASKRGSGAVAVDLMAGGIPLHALLNEPMVRALTRELRPPHKPYEPPSARYTCVGARRVRLELWARETQIELGELHSLSPGDVILLDVPISEPLQVTIDGKPTGRCAYLGRLGQRRALQLLPAQRS